MVGVFGGAANHFDIFLEGKPMLDPCIKMVIERRGWHGETILLLVNE